MDKLKERLYALFSGASHMRWLEKKAKGRADLQPFADHVEEYWHEYYVADQAPSPAYSILQRIEAAQGLTIVP
jgi:hypothetical protein